MSLLTVLRSGVAIANKITKPLQATVTYQQCVTSSDGYGTKVYGPQVTLLAIVDWNARQLRTKSGELSVCRASILLLDIASVVAATNGEGIGDFDLFVLPDGTTGPVLDLQGFLDAGTGHPIATTVMIG